MNEITRAVEDEVAHWRDASVSFERRRKHICATVSTPSGKRMVFLAATASDFRAQRNVVALVRRYLKELRSERA